MASEAHILLRCIFAQKPDLAADCFRSFLVVASDDNHTDTSRAAFCDGLPDFPSWGVNHSKRSNKRHFTLHLLELVGIGQVQLGRIRDSFEGEADAAQSQFVATHHAHFLLNCIA